MKNNHNLSAASFSNIARKWGTRVSIESCDSRTGFYAFAIDPNLREYATTRKYRSREHLVDRLKEHGCYSGD